MSCRQTQSASYRILSYRIGSGSKTHADAGAGPRHGANIRSSLSRGSPRGPDDCSPVDPPRFVRRLSCGLAGATGLDVGRRQRTRITRSLDAKSRKATGLQGYRDTAQLGAAARSGPRAKRAEEKGRRRELITRVSCLPR